MKHESTEIIEYLRTLPNIKRTHFSESSKKLLTKLIGLFTEGSNAFPHIQINKTISANNKDTCDNYVPKEIQAIIKQQNKQKIHFQFAVRDRRINLSLYHFENISEALIKQHVKRIFIWLHTALHFAHAKCSRVLKINIYFTKAKKGFPSAKMPIHPVHANSAFTTSCSSETEINVFREEEWFKVLIHETFHCLGLDFSEMNREDSNAHVLRILPVSSDVRLYETYCETWAETINVLIIAFLSTRSDNIVKILDKAEKMIHYERLFSLSQCVKVLKHYHLSYDDLHKKDAQSHAKRTANYKEETQVLSYYIIKCIFMFHINEYIEWCISNNGETLNFRKTPGTIRRYVGLLESLYLNAEFLSCIKLFENISTKNTSTSLRMSAWEL